MMNGCASNHKQCSEKLYYNKTKPNKLTFGQRKEQNQKKSRQRIHCPSCPKCTHPCHFPTLSVKRSHCRLLLPRKWTSSIPDVYLVSLHSSSVAARFLAGVVEASPTTSDIPVTVIGGHSGATVRPSSLAIPLQ